MDPITSASILTTVVGLICNWKQERDSTSQDNFNDFIVWLENHNFQAIKERIFESEELQRDLSDLLRSDIASISTKLDLVCDAVSAVSSKIDGLADIGTSLESTSDLLSDQACEILKLFADASDADRLILRRMAFIGEPARVEFWLTPGGRAFAVDSPRFANDDVDALAALGFIRHVGFTNDRMPMYALTRSGQQFAAQLPPVVLNPDPNPSSNASS